MRSLQVTLTSRLKLRRWLRGCAGAFALAGLGLSPRLARAEDSKSSKKSEFSAVPFVGGDSDVGWGGGFIASWARLSPRLEPYLLRIEAATAITGKKTDDGVEFPYTDAYLLFEMPHVLPNRYKLRLRISYTREATLNYYGIGNASELDHVATTHYERVHPTVDLQSEYRMTQALRLNLGVAYTRNRLQLPSDGLLAQEMREASPVVRELLGDARPHDVLAFSYGVSIDLRDDIVNPHSGFLATARVDLAPGAMGAFSHRWARHDASLRGFIPLIPSRLTLAARVVSDFLFGDAPFYELARYDSTSAIGGVHGVRGIPAGRYAGKIKAFGNVELRSELFSAKVLGKPTRFGITGFVDAGRVWADYQRRPELDGTGLGLKYGAGGGVRIVAGKSFVLRLDAAWSKEASPLAAYLTSGHAF